MRWKINLPEPTGLPVHEKLKRGIRVDFWVRNIKTGKTEVVDKKWYEANKEKWGLIHVNATTCRWKRLYFHKVVDEVTKKTIEKEYCAYWRKYVEGEDE